MAQDTPDRPKRKRNRKSAPLEDRLWPKVNKGGPIPECAPHLGPCWLWLAYRDHQGYGKFYRPVGSLFAHRVVYELLVGPIPDGLTLDHLCRVRHCVNPTHVEAVPIGVNVRRGQGPTMLRHLTGTCFRGHDQSVHGYQRPDGRGQNCRECRRELRRVRIEAWREGIRSGAPWTPKPW